MQILRPARHPRARVLGVVLSDVLDSEGQPNRTESFLVNVSTSEVSRPSPEVYATHIVVPRTSAGVDMETA